MSIVTAIVFVLLLTMTGCVASNPAPAAKQDPDKKASTVKPATHDERKSMNEESQDAVR